MKRFAERRIYAIEILRNRLHGAEMIIPRIRERIYIIFIDSHYIEPIDSKPVNSSIA